MPKTENVIYVCTDTDVWKETARNLKSLHGWEPALFVSFKDTPPSDSKDIFYNIPFYSLSDARMAEIPNHIPEFTMGAYDVELFA